MDVVSMRRTRSLSSYCGVTDEIKNKLVSVSTRCQHLENKVAGKKVKLYILMQVTVRHL